MKLDNKGWGTREMIYLSTGIFLALGISMYFISVLYASIGKTTRESVYAELENKLEIAASRYANDNDLNINGTYKISSGTLKKAGYIENLKDNDGKICGGYVIISDNSTDTEYTAYISCDNYVTEGY